MGALCGMSHSPGWQGGLGPDQDHSLPPFPVRGEDRPKSDISFDFEYDSAHPNAAMRIVMFYHSLLSDWNHGNAHFLRGVAWELTGRGHTVDVLEPADGWSLTHL